MLYLCVELEHLSNSEICFSALADFFSINLKARILLKMENQIIKLVDKSTNKVIRQFRLRKGTLSQSERLSECLSLAVKTAKELKLHGWINVVEKTTQKIYLLSWAGFEVEKSTVKEVASFLLDREDAWSVSLKSVQIEKVSKSYIVDFR